LSFCQLFSSSHRNFFDKTTALRVKPLSSYHKGEPFAKACSPDFQEKQLKSAREDRGKRRPEPVKKNRAA